MYTQITAPYPVRSIFVLHAVFLQLTFPVSFNEIIPKIYYKAMASARIYLNPLSHFTYLLTLAKVARDSFRTKTGFTCTEHRGRDCTKYIKAYWWLRRCHCHQMLSSLSFMFILLLNNIGFIFFCM